MTRRLARVGEGERARLAEAYADGAGRCSRGAPAALYAVRAKGGESFDPGPIAAFAGIRGLRGRCGPRLALESRSEALDRAVAQLRAVGAPFILTPRNSRGAARRSKSLAGGRRKRRGSAGGSRPRLVPRWRKPRRGRARAGTRPVARGARRAAAAGLAAARRRAEARRLQPRLCRGARRPGRKRWPKAARSPAAMAGRRWPRGAAMPAGVAGAPSIVIGGSRR